MEQETRVVKKRVFLLSWILLMLLTGFLMAIGISGMGVGMKTFLVLVMMAAQAYLVSFYFMHLRFEKLPLVLATVLGVLVTAGILYALIVWDGTRIVRLSGP